MSRHYLGLDYDVVTLPQLLRTFGNRPVEARFAYLVTPNVDHVVRLHEPGADGEAVLAAYRSATWCVCDSRILAALARLSGIDLPVVPGSDLTVAVVRELVRPGDRIALVGGDPQTVDGLAAAMLGTTLLHHQPPMGLRHDPVALAQAAAFVAESRARFTFLAVGSPQQELLAKAIADRGDAIGIGLCIGAGIAFVTGDQRRAPRAVQRLHLEWAYRLAGDPKRLWRRYLVTGPRIFRIALAGARERRRG